MLLYYCSYDEAVEQLEITMKDLQDAFVDKKQVRPLKWQGSCDDTSCSDVNQ